MKFDSSVVDVSFVVKQTSASELNNEHRSFELKLKLKHFYCQLHISGTDGLYGYKTVFHGFKKNEK